MSICPEHNPGSNKPTWTCIVNTGNQLDSDLKQSMWLGGLDYIAQLALVYTVKRTQKQRLHWNLYQQTPSMTAHLWYVVSDIAIFVLKRDVKLQLTNLWYVGLAQHRTVLTIASRPSDHYFRSVCLSVCLSVCAEFFSAVFDPIWIKLGHMLHVRV